MLTLCLCYACALYSLSAGGGDVMWQRQSGGNQGAMKAARHRYIYTDSCSCMHVHEIASDCSVSSVSSRLSSRCSPLCYAPMLQPMLVVSIMPERYDRGEQWHADTSVPAECKRQRPALCTQVAARSSAGEMQETWVRMQLGAGGSRRSRHSSEYVRVGG